MKMPRAHSVRTLIAWVSATRASPASFSVASWFALSSARAFVAFVSASLGRLEMLCDAALQSGVFQGG